MQESATRTTTSRLHCPSRLENGETGFKSNKETERKGRRRGRRRGMTRTGGTVPAFRPADPRQRRRQITSYNNTTSSRATDTNYAEALRMARPAAPRAPTDTRVARAPQLPEKEQVGLAPIKKSTDVYLAALRRQV